MIQKVNLQTAEHRSLGLLSDRWDLWQAQRLTIIQERVGVGCGGRLPHQVGAPLFYYVVQGQATLEAGGYCVLLERFEGCSVPVGVPHRLRNAGSEELFLLVISGGDLSDLHARPCSWDMPGLVKPDFETKVGGTNQGGL